MKYILIFLIKIYQQCISPFFPDRCNFRPTCSQYGIDAIKEWGVIKGIVLIIKRISKCHYGRGWTHDPVPKKER
ncbi:MAG: membrane protein insertion efficiency factor YidD [Rickettsiales bacterium]|nr:MAG: membrane protein insertion efficiency factor YidD [Rickettsiales bacterium]GMO61204.1 MAG: membrane protein insertion efficiency factor YidD [Rickettsiales bacterium]